MILSGLRKRLKLFSSSNKNKKQPSLPRAERVTEPLGERAALGWDRDLGIGYSQLVLTPAWQHLAGEIDWLQGLMVRRLIDEKGDQNEARATVKLIEQILSIPVTMIQRGHESEQGLKRMANERVE